MPFINGLFPGGDSNPLTQNLFFWSTLDPIEEASVPWDDRTLNVSDYPAPVAYDPGSTGLEWIIDNFISKHHGIKVAAPLLETYVNTTRFRLQSSDPAYNTDAKIGAALLPGNEECGFVIRAQMGEATSTSQYSVAGVGDTATGGMCLVRRGSGVSSPNQMALVIDTSAGTETAIFTAAITDTQDHLFAVKVNAAGDTVSLSVDSGAFEDVALSGTVNAGTYTGYIAGRRHSSAWTDGFRGSLSQLGWYVGGFISEANLATLWNDGVGATVSGGEPTAIDTTGVGTYDYTVGAAGVAAGGKTDFFVPTSNFAGARLRMGFQLNIPMLGVNGPTSYIVARTGVNQHMQIRRDGTTSLTFGIYNGGVNTVSISPAFPAGYGRLLDDNWITIMLSWTQSASAADFYVWYWANGFDGWRKATGSGNNNSSLTWMHTTHSEYVGSSLNSHECQVRQFFATDQNLDFDDQAVRESFFIGGQLPKQLDTSGWTEFNSTQPRVYAPDGDLVNSNLGSRTFTNGGSAPSVVSPATPYAPLTLP